MQSLEAAGIPMASGSARPALSKLPPAYSRTL